VSPMDAHLTVAEIATWLGCPRQRVVNWTIRGWRSGGEHRRLARIVGDDGFGRYRLGDALEAERDTRRSSRSHRRIAAPAASTRS